MKTSDREILKGYYWNHDAIRKDIERFERIGSRLDNYSADNFKDIKHWFDFHCMALTAHHEGEDHFFFPKMKARTDVFEKEMQEFDHEHKELDRYMEKINEELTGLSAGMNGETKKKLKQSLSEYIRLMNDHLGKEEKIVEKVVNEYFKREEVL